MTLSMKSVSIGTALAASMLAASCTAPEETASPVEPDLAAFSAFFAEANVVGEPKLVDCTLSGGTETTCYSITVKPQPNSYVPGPWCPANISDTKDAGGIWLESGKVYDVDGNFIANMSDFYDDPKWQLYDKSTGKINVTDTKEKCGLAARPNVDESMQNHCVECLPEYLDADATRTFIIPVSPVQAVETAEVRGTPNGVSLNGITLDGPAPVEAILGAYTIAPFDDCGGHINVNAGYHYHAATECLSKIAADSAAGKQIGIAMDGYGIYAQLLGNGEAPESLDSCGGHEGEGVRYHYHAGAEGSNKILSCMVAEYGCALDDPDASCDATASVQRGPPPGNG